ncbi:MAG: carboxylesterase family protein [Nitrospira sp.]|nr:carboxylesterase family protein [Nitrospira sp.]
MRFPRFVQDSAQALAWVSTHIAEFHGDPARIRRGTLQYHYFHQEDNGKAVGIRSVTWRSGASRVAPIPTTKLIKLRSLHR